MPIIPMLAMTMSTTSTLVALATECVAAKTYEPGAKKVRQALLPEASRTILAARAVRQLCVATRLQSGALARPSERERRL